MSKWLQRFLRRDNNPGGDRHVVIVRPDAVREVVSAAAISATTTSAALVHEVEASEEQDAACAELTLPIEHHISVESRNLTSSRSTTSEDIEYGHDAGMEARGMSRQISRPSGDVDILPSNILFAEGLTFASKGNHKKAVSKFQQASRLDPYNIDITEYLLRSQQYLRSAYEDPARQKAIFSHHRRSSLVDKDSASLEERSRFVASRSKLKLTVEEDDDEEETIGDTFVSISDAKVMAQSLYDEGLRLAKVGDHKAAIKKYDESFVYFKTKECSNSRALSLYFSNQIKEAREACEGIIASYPDYGEAHSTLGYIYRSLADAARTSKHKAESKTYTEMAIKQFRLATPSYKESYSYLFDKALWYMDQGKYHDAKRKLEEALALLEKTSVFMNLDNPEDIDNGMVRVNAKENIEELLHSVRQYLIDHDKSFSLMRSVRVKKEKPPDEYEQKLRQKQGMDSRPVEDSETASSTLSPKDTLVAAAYKAAYQFKLNTNKGEMQRLQAGFSYLKAEVDSLRGDHVSRHDVSAAIITHHSLQEIDRQRKFIESITQLREYYEAFKRTFSTIFTSSEVVDGGQFDVSTGSIIQTGITTALSFIPLCGDFISTVVDNVATFVQEAQIARKARKFLTLGSSGTDFDVIVDAVARALTISKKQDIMKGDVKEESRGWLKKIIDSCKNLGEKFDEKVYSTLYKTDAAKLGNEDASNIIMAWVKNETDVINKMDKIKFLIHALLPSYVLDESGIDVYGETQDDDALSQSGGVDVAHASSTDHAHADFGLAVLTLPRDLSGDITTSEI
jgi:tetratricopeptide (TPR) repeat protein